VTSSGTASASRGALSSAWPATIGRPSAAANPRVARILYWLGRCHWYRNAFADGSGQKLRTLMDVLADSEQSPVCRFTPKGADIDSVIDVRAIFQQGHRDLKVEDLPSLLLPRKGRFGLIDYEKAYTPDLKSGLDIFDLRGIDREWGAMVVVRPDQHVANVLPLDAHAELTAFFERFMLDRH